MKKQFNPKVLFLIDGIGAVISTIMLGYVLIKYQEYIGMPESTLRLLAGIAKLFALYSFICFFLTPKNWSQSLRWIAIANTLFCLLTLILVIINFSSLSLLGLSYFLVEMLIILLLVRFEFKFSLGR